MRVAQEYLSLDQLTACALLPESGSEALTEETVSTALQSGHDRVATRERITPTERPPKPAPAPPPPLRESPEERGPGTIHTYPLPGGGALYVSPRRSVPVVAGRAAFFGGLLADTEEQAGLSSFLTSMWSRGTERHDAAAFARAVEDLAAEVSGFSGRS